MCVCVTYAHVCQCMSVRVCACEYMCAHMHVCVYVYACLWMYDCTHVCASGLCVCMCVLGILKCLSPNCRADLQRHFSACDPGPHHSVG